MANEKNETDRKQAVKTETTDENKTATPRIVWDDAKMRSSYANVCHASSTREEFTLLFGMNQAWHAGQKDVKIELNDRIVMSPMAAKRLSILLNRVLGEYEKRYGTLDVDVQKMESPA